MRFFIIVGAIAMFFGLLWGSIMNNPQHVCGETLPPPKSLYEWAHNANKDAPCEQPGWASDPARLRAQDSAMCRKPENKLLCWMEAEQRKKFPQMYRGR